jgi:putative heme-binding domain-containing protein
LLRTYALDKSLPVALRALAVTGLGHSVNSPDTRGVLARLQNQPVLGARRTAEQKRTVDEWRKLLDGAGDSAAGERVFFNPLGPGCYKCHQIDNRGAGVGPELTFAGKSMTREKIIESILEPSKEIAPAYTAWRISTRDGKERVGMIVGETFDSFVLVADSEGKIAKIPRTEIEEREALPKSIMPDELPNLMTRQEFLDLIAYLMDRK